MKSHRWIRAAAAVAAGVVWFAAGAAPGSTPAPYDVVVHVLWGDDDIGPEALRAQVERTVIHELDRAQCFDTLSRFGGEDEQHVAPDGDADLMFDIVISNLEVREDWSVSVVEKASPNQQQDKIDGAQLATVEFDVTFDLGLLPDKLPLRHKRYHHAQSYRPQYGGDPREQVRAEVIDDLARDARSFLCKGTKKLTKAIDQARTAPD